MNMIDVQEKLKDFSEDQLVREMQAPTGIAPQFLVLSEMTRRKRMRDSMQPQDTGTTVAEEVVSAAGVPQGGIATMAQALAPKSSMAQNTGASPMPVQGMYGGGYVQKMQDGGIATLMANPAARAYAEKEAQRLGITLEQYLQQAMPPGTNKMLTDFANRTATRDRMLGFEPAGDGITFPTQADLDARFSESQAREPVFPDSGFSQPAPMPQPMTYGRPLFETLAAKTGNLLPGDQVDLDLTLPELPDMGNIRDTLKQFENDYTTTTEDFTRPITEFFSRPDETVRTIDPYTGKYVDMPTFGTQVRRAGNAVAGLVSDLPMFDLSAGDPYSELSSEEMAALANGNLSPETADSIQSSRLAMQQYGRGTSGSATAVAPAGREGADTPETTAPETTTSADTQPPVTDTTPAVETVTSGGGRGSGSGIAAAVGAAPMTSYEQELMDAMKRADRRAEQDKWLSLAQVGLNLMSSKQPTLGGAIGEAGMAGLGAFQQARNTAEEERLGLSKALYDIQASREAAMAAQRAAGARAAAAGLPKLSELEDYYKALTVETKAYDEQGNEITKRVARNPEDAGTVAQIEDAMTRMAISRVAPMM